MTEIPPATIYALAMSYLLLAGLVRALGSSWLLALVVALFLMAVGAVITGLATLALLCL